MEFLIINCLYFFFFSFLFFSFLSLWLLPFLFFLFLSFFLPLLFSLLNVGRFSPNPGNSRVHSRNKVTVAFLLEGGMTLGQQTLESLSETGDRANGQSVGSGQR